MASNEIVKRNWRKILYEDQGLPDNYVDVTFLDEMKKNLHVRKYEFKLVAIEAGTVHQQLSCICLFVVVYAHLLLDNISSFQLILWLGPMLLIGYIFTWVMRAGAQRSWKRLISEARSSLVFLSLSLGLTPLLHTLTTTISTDTIYAMTFFLLLASWAFHDYLAPKQLQSNAVSVNAGLSAAICLGSRLPGHWHTFATVTMAIAVFALWPELRKYLKVTQKLVEDFIVCAGESIAYPWSQITVTCILFLLALIGLFSLSPMMSGFFLIGSLTINLAVPALLIAMQTMKNNIHGPWDEAMIIPS